MEWATVQTALVTAVQTALGDLTADVTWADRTTGWRQPLHVKLQVLAYVGLGRHERRYTDEGADDIRERIYQPRRLVISFRAETRDQDLVSSALEAAERISAGLDRTDVEDILATAGLGIARVEQVRQVNAPDDKGKVRSVAVLDVRFNAATSLTGSLVPWIKAVEFSGELPEEGLTVGPVTVQATTGLGLEQGGGLLTEAGDRLILEQLP